GHPLVNAMFTAFALCIAIAMPYARWLKGLLILIFITSLVAFGGRAALMISVLGVLTLGLFSLKRVLFKRELTLMKLLVIITAVLVVPVLLAGMLYLTIYSSMGERIAKNLLW